MRAAPRSTTFFVATAFLMAGVAFTPQAWAVEATTKTTTTTTTTAPAKAPAAVTTTAKPAAPAAAPATAPASQGVKRVSSAAMKTFKTALSTANNKNAVLRQQLQKMRQQQSAIATAATFDKAAFIAKSNEMETLNAQMHKNTTDVTAAALAQLTVEERKVILKSMARKGAQQPNKQAAK